MKRRRVPLRITLACVLVCLLPAVLCAGPDLPDTFKKYETSYYIIYTDLPIDQVREAAMRMTCMAEEYHDRTKGFSGTIRRKFPFFLFSKREDYHRAGGVPGSAGVYMYGRALMAIAKGSFTWHVVQHEGFHQFVHMVIRGNIPIWVNEGLAEYFGNGIWTGDGLVTGVAPGGRIARVQGHIKKGKILPMLEMLTMTHKEWNSQLAIRNYDQAWSMVHFLVHAEDGKYREAFGKFINDISRGRNWEKSYVRRFGRDTKAFEKKYSQWWLARDKNESADLYTRAVVETLTSYLARAQVMDRKYDNAEEFFRSIDAGKVQVDPKKHLKLWLPNSLGKKAVKQAKGKGEWKLVMPEKGFPKITLTRKDGTVFEGSFSLPRSRRPKVEVAISKPEQEKE
ncbi:MAG: DUF1570 domain-containing protein [Phycisphaerae bacterium]